MVKVFIPKRISFCSGIIRAIQKATRTLSVSPSLVALKPFVNNTHIMNLLAKRGIIERESVTSTESAPILIGIHGLSPAKRRVMKEASLTLCDTTCPKILKIQAIISKYHHQGYAIIIAGKIAHPETEAFIGFAGDDVSVVENTSEAEKLVEKNKALLVSQSSFPHKQFLFIAEVIKKKCRECHIIETTCPEAERRYEEGERIAQKTDLVLVVGGKDSVNAQHLVKIASQFVATKHIEEANEIDTINLSGVKKIGLLSATETPLPVFRECIQRLKYPSTKGLGSISHGVLELRKWFKTLGFTSAFGAVLLMLVSNSIQALPHTLSLLSIAWLMTVFAIVIHTAFTSGDRKTTYATSSSRSQKKVIISVGLLSAFASILTTFQFHRSLLIPVLGALATILLYLLPVLPSHRATEKQRCSLYDSYGVKELGIVLFSIFICVWLPWLDGNHGWRAALVPAIVFVSLYLMIRKLLYDLKDLQIHIMTQIDTFSSVWGVTFTKNSIIVLVVTWIIALALAQPLRITGSIAPLLLVCPLLLTGYLFIYNRRIFKQGLFNCNFIDSLCLIAGGIALLFGFFNVS